MTLALQDLADLQHPDLSYSRMAWVQNKGLFAAVRRSGGQCEFTGVSVHTVLQPQTAHLHTHQFLLSLLLLNTKLDPKKQTDEVPWCCIYTGSQALRSPSFYLKVHWRLQSVQRGRLFSPSSCSAGLRPVQPPWRCPAGGDAPEQWSFPVRDRSHEFNPSVQTWNTFLMIIYWHKQVLTSNPWSRPTFIMSLHLFGTMHMTSTAFYNTRTSSV